MPYKYYYRKKKQTTDQTKTKPKKCKKTRRLLRNDGYVRPSETTQERISSNIDLMYKKLKSYIPVPIENYKDIPTGINIKYISEQGKYREGGTLVVNSAPDYFVLVNGFVSWSVNLKTNRIFMEDYNNRTEGENQVIKDHKEKNMIKDKLYKLYLQGLIEFKVPDGDDNTK